MIVLMMRIRIMRMFMRHPLVPVPVTVACSRQHRLCVGMLMMDVVRVLVFVFDWIMRMQMFVPLGKVQRYAQSHQNASRDKRNRDGFAEKRYREQRPCERRYREISSCARCAQFA